MVCLFVCFLMHACLAHSEWANKPNQTKELSVSCNTENTGEKERIDVSFHWIISSQLCCVVFCVHLDTLITNSGWRNHCTLTWSLIWCLKSKDDTSSLRCKETPISERSLPTSEIWKMLKKWAFWFWEEEGWGVGLEWQWCSLARGKWRATQGLIH